MLDVALKFLTKELNAYLLVRTGSALGEVKLGPIVDGNGKWTIPLDQIGATVVNLEEERSIKSQVPESTLVDGRHVVLPPAIHLNLYVLFAANLQQYEEALRLLSCVLTFFQSHPVFTPARYPGLDPRIEKLSAELQSLTFEQINQVWAFLGGKHLPSVIYKVRMVSLRDTEQTVVPPVTRTEPVLHSL
jgi:Pvc16 N-terminal domain